MIIKPEELKIVYEKEDDGRIRPVYFIDAVEVVRCKDCEYYTAEERWCRRLGLCGAFDQNDYCSHAERRTDAID